MLAFILAIAEEAATDEKRFILPHADELIWGSLAFLILFLVLSKVAFPSINKMLAERQAKIRSGLEQAEATKLEADKMLEQYRRQLDEARGEAAKIIEEARRSAESVRTELVEKAERESQEIVARARTEVAGEASRARQQLQGDLINLSLELASRVIQRELAQPESQKQFVERTIAELASTGGNGQN